MNRPKPGQRWLVDDPPRRKFIIEILDNNQHKVVSFYSGDYHVGYIGWWCIVEGKVFTLLEGQEAPEK